LVDESDVDVLGVALHVHLESGRGGEESQLRDGNVDWLALVENFELDSDVNCQLLTRGRRPVLEVVPLVEVGDVRHDLVDLRLWRERGHEAGVLLVTVAAAVVATVRVVLGVSLRRHRGSLGVGEVR
jgi:hypothetical protein